MVSLQEAASGHAAKTTASRNAAGAIVGNSTGSRYVREQEARARSSSGSGNARDSTSTGKIQLKNGSYISQFEAVGRKNGAVKVFSSKNSMLSAYNERLKAANISANQQKAYRTIKLKNGKSAAAIKTNGNTSTGERGVRVVQYKGRIDSNGVFHKDSSSVILSVSKTAQEHKSDERASAARSKAEKYSVLEQAKVLYDAGKRIAAGENLTRKQQAVVAKYSTTEEFRHSKLSKLIEKKGGDLSKYLGKVSRKDKAVAMTDGTPIIGSVVKGVYDVTDTPVMFGEAVKGFERWAQKPRTILPSIPVGAGMSVQSIETDPVRFAASLVTMNKLGKATGYATGKTGAAVGKATGIVRDKTVLIKNQPYHPVGSQGAMIDAVTKQPKISGARATDVHYLKQEVYGKPIGIKTFKNPLSKSGKQYIPGRAIKKLTGAPEQTLTRFKEAGRVDDSYAAPVHTSYMVPDLTKGHYEQVGIHFLDKYGVSKLRQEVQLLENVQTVASELTDLHRGAIADYAKTGKIDPKVFQDIQLRAAAKSKRINQPVATLTPKTGSGFYKPELEVLLVYGSEASTKVTSSKIVGFTSSGVKIRKIRFGSQEAIADKLWILENMQYNWKNFVSGKGEYVKGMAEFANRKIAETEGKALMKPDQYTKHGTKHTIPVENEAVKLWKSSPTLQSKYSLLEFKVAAKLHDSMRLYGTSKAGETEPLAHGPAMAKAIRHGLIKDKELQSLPKASQLRVAKAIETHMTIRPISRVSVVQGLKTSILTRPNDFQKALATADRLARAQEAGYVKKGMIFKIPEETASFKAKKVVTETTGYNKFKTNTAAELLPRKTMTKRVTSKPAVKTTKQRNLAKVRTARKRTSTKSGKRQKEDAQTYEIRGKSKDNNSSYYTRTTKKSIRKSGYAAKTQKKATESKGYAKTTKQKNQKYGGYTKTKNSSKPYAGKYSDNKHTSGYSSTYSNEQKPTYPASSYSNSKKPSYATTKTSSTNKGYAKSTTSTARKSEHVILLRRKRKSKQKKYKVPSSKYIKGKRKVKNTLGNMKSMLG